MFYVIFVFSELRFVCFFFFFQAEDGIRDYKVTGVQTCALPICADAACGEQGGHEPGPPESEHGAAADPAWHVGELRRTAGRRQQAADWRHRDRRLRAEGAGVERRDLRAQGAPDGSRRLE